MPDFSNEWYIIVNPHAGSGKTMYKWIPTENYLAELGVRFNTVFTTHKHHASELAATAARLGYRNLMAVGGDGSIHEVMRGILTWCDQTGTDPSEFKVCVSPIGSGNDWIKTFAVPNDGIEVCKLIAADSFTKSDVAKITFGKDSETTYMANIGGCGFDSHVCVAVNRQKEHGKRNKYIYLYALLRAIFTIKPINVKFVVDGELKYAGRCLSFALGNGPYSGGGMRQCSLAKPDDGLLDVMIVPKLSIIRILSEVPTLFKGNIDKCSYLHYFQYKTLEVTPMDEASADVVEVDGEVEAVLPIKVEVTGQTINVLTGHTAK